MIYSYFGESFIESSGIKSLEQATERKVLVNYRDYTNACLGTFRECELPDKERVFKKDTTIEIVIPKGFIDHYTCQYECVYDKIQNTLLVEIIDSLVDKKDICKSVIEAYSSKSKQTDILIGSINFKISLNDTILPERVCNLPVNSPLVKIKIARQLIQADNFTLLLNKKEVFNYKIEDGYIIGYFNLNEQPVINVYTKNNIFKKSKLLLKGNIDYSISTLEPVNKCQIDFEKDIHKFVFIKKASYSTLKFSKEETIINLYNSVTTKSISVDLKDIKFNKKKGVYILSKKDLRALTKKQL